MKTFLITIAAVFITLTAVVYQRLTGPTNPKRVEFAVDGFEYKARFIRSTETLLTLDNYKDSKEQSKIEITLKRVDRDSLVKIESMKLLYRIYPGNDTLSVSEGVKSSKGFLFSLPSQPPAGKLIYYPVINMDNGEEMPISTNGVIIRFKSPVPGWALIPHVFLMFFAMLLSNLAGIMAFFKHKRALKIALLTLFMFALGGLFFGPIVQKFAFGAYWTGWPFGADLTDNKTLLVFVFWLIAYLMNRKRERRYLLIIASIITMLVYTIPHSTAGSQFDHEKGVVVTG